MAFRFRLSTLLRLRERVRDERRAHLAEAFRALDIVKKRREEVEAELAAALAERRSSAEPGRVRVDRLIDSHRHELVLRDQQQTLVKQQSQLADEVERRREALVAADRDVRVLERLRERQQEREVAAEGAADIKRLDEIAGRRANREEEATWAG